MEREQAEKIDHRQEKMKRGKAKGRADEAAKVKVSRSQRRKQPLSLSGRNHGRFTGQARSWRHTGRAIDNHGSMSDPGIKSSATSRRPAWLVCSMRLDSHRVNVLQEAITMCRPKRQVSAAAGLTWSRRR